MPVDTFSEYLVNVMVDNSETKGAPVIIEPSPTYKNIFGSVERVVDRSGKRFMSEYEPYLQDTGARPLARYAAEVQDFGSKRAQVQVVKDKAFRRHSVISDAAPLAPPTK